MNPQAPDADSIRESLRCIDDPELDCNIVDLGLVYGVEVVGTQARVTLTMTSRGCPLHQTIVDGVTALLLSLPGLEEAQVELVWTPPWSPALMTPFARARLGALV